MLSIINANNYIKQLKTKIINDKYEKTVKEIISNVINNGDNALLQYAKEFDKVNIKNFSLEYTKKEIQKITIPNPIKEIIDEAYKNIHLFHSKEKEESWFFSKNNATLGQIINPIEKIGAYIPGGKGIYPSTVLMNCIPAQIAGVPEIYITVPPLPNGTIDPAILYAAKLCGVKSCYKIGGASAIAALAYGTETIPKVYKIVGPGNMYVTTAKKMVYGIVDIDMIAGPSEIMILADENSPIDYITYDLFSQSEHSEDSSSIVLVPNTNIANKIIQSVKNKIILSKRKNILKQSLSNNGKIVIYSKLNEAFSVINEYAPEHLSILTKLNFNDIVKNIKNVGSIFIGKYTPEPVGDYFAGTNHSLPTNGSAKFFSPLGVYDFQKRTSFSQYPKSLLLKEKDKIIKFAEYEGFFEHANSVRIRCN